MPNVIQPSRAAVSYPPASQLDRLSVEADNSNGRIWVTALSFYVFLLVSRVLDLSPIWFLHIPMILLIVLTLALFAKGGLQEILRQKIPRFLVMFTGWVLVCFPLSHWRGGSVNYVIWSIQALMIFMMIVRMVRTPADWQKIASAYAYGVLVAALLSFKYGQYVEGRLALNNGSLADPNEFALTLVIGLPLWWLKMSNATPVKKVLMLLATVPIFYVFSKTGSRAGLLALATVFAVVMWFASPAQKVLMATLAIAAVVAGLLFLPPYLKVRYFTTFSQSAEDLQNPNLDQESRDRLSASIDSGNERQALLRQSVSMTFRYPLFGVGPGIFPVVAWDERKAETGLGGVMFVSHNTYTQISSETGLPGIFLFGGMLFFCFKFTIQDFRKQRKKNGVLAKNGLFILTTVSGLAVGIFFLSMGYSTLLAAMFGLTASLHNVIQRNTELEASGLSGDVKAASLPTQSAMQPSTTPKPEVSAPVAARHRRFARLSQPPGDKKGRSGTDWYSRLTE
jgi:O-antigen ligase